MLASPLLVWLIVQAHYGDAFAVIVFAGLTDWFDGYTARLFDASGRLGVILDPLADKFMLVVLFCALTYVGLIPLWFFALVVVRDLVIVTGAILVRRLRNVRKFPPVTVGKVSTFFQIVYALLALLFGALPHPLVLWLERTALVLSTIFTIWSGYAYIRIGIRYAHRPPMPDLAE